MMRQAKAALEAAVHQLAGLEASAQRRAQRALDKLETFVPRVHQVIRQKQRWFRRGRAWRAGGEARIGLLKHSYGMHRSRYRGEDATVRTIGWAGIAHNLTVIARA
jgi:hypothetical protein